MNADSAYIEPFLYDWVDHLQKIMNERKQEIINERYLTMPCQALTTHIVKAFTYIANYLGLDHHVKYMALELFDKFMNKYFCETYNEKNDQSDEWWENFKKKTCTYKKLYFMSCFQVACKVNSHLSGLKISQVLEFLHTIDKNYEYTQDMVSSAEIEILKKVGFRMPLYTPVYCIEILLAAINSLKLPFNGNREPIEYRGILFTTSMQLLDLAYFEHEKLYHHFQLYLGLYKNVSMRNQEKELRLRILKSNTLFLSAAIVLCARYILYPNISDIADKIIVVNLAKLVNVRNIDVIVMANILFQIIQGS